MLRICLDTRLGDGGLFEDADNTVTGLLTTRRNAGGRTGITELSVKDDWTITDGFPREAGAPGAVTTTLRHADRNGAEATGFRLPTLNGLYRPFVVFPVATQANAALVLEKLRGVEAGLDLHPVRGVTFGPTTFTTPRTARSPMSRSPPPSASAATSRR